MTHFEIAFGRLSVNDQKILLEKIEDWKNSYGWKSERVVENFKEEHFLAVELILELMEFIISKKNTKDFNNIKNELQTLFYSKYQLKGDSIKQHPYPIIVGFAISINEYKDNLMRLYGKSLFDLDENEIEKFIINCSQGIYDKIYSDCLFKHDFKLIWMTWDKTSDIHNPFCFIKYNKSEEVTVTLGLDKTRFKPPLLLFQIDITKINDGDFILYRPTFCDSDFYENFKPTPIDFKDYGLTQPLVNIISDNGDSYNPERRPETITRSKYVKLDKIKNVIYLNR